MAFCANRPLEEFRVPLSDVCAAAARLRDPADAIALTAAINLVAKRTVILPIKNVLSRPNTADVARPRNAADDLSISLSARPPRRAPSCRTRRPSVACWGWSLARKHWWLSCCA